MVLVLTRPGCLFCSQVVELLRSASVPFETREVAERDEQQRVALEHGAHSFPIVLVDGVYLGGYAHIVRLSGDGRLHQLGAPTAQRALSPPPPRQSWSSRMDALRAVNVKK